MLQLCARSANILSKETNYVNAGKAKDLWYKAALKPVKGYESCIQVFHVYIALYELIIKAHYQSILVKNAIPTAT